MLQSIEFQQFRFQTVIGVRQLRIGGAHGRGQRLDDFGLDAIAEMARGGGVGEFAPGVLDFFVLRQRVRDVREQAQVRFEGFGQRLRRIAADVAFGLRQEMQRFFAGQFLAADIVAQRRQRLVVEPDPGAVRRLRAVVEGALEFVVELIGFERPQMIEPRLVAAQFRLERARAPSHRRECGSVRDRRTEIPNRSWSANPRCRRRVCRSRDRWRRRRRRG